MLWCTFRIFSQKILMRQYCMLQRESTKMENATYLAAGYIKLFNLRSAETSWSWINNDRVK